jgi:hypothetical protein
MPAGCAAICAADALKADGALERELRPDLPSAAVLRLARELHPVSRWRAFIACRSPGSPWWIGIAPRW